MPETSTACLPILIKKKKLWAVLVLGRS